MRPDPAGIGAEVIPQVRASLHELDQFLDGFVQVAAQPADQFIERVGSRGQQLSNDLECLVKVEPVQDKVNEIARTVILESISRKMMGTRLMV